MMRSYRDWDPWQHFNYPGATAKMNLYRRICEMDDAEFVSCEQKLISEVENMFLSHLETITSKKRKLT